MRRELLSFPLIGFTPSFYSELQSNASLVFAFSDYLPSALAYSDYADVSLVSEVYKVSLTLPGAKSLARTHNLRTKQLRFAWQGALSSGGEWVAFKLRTTTGTEKSGSVNYFILFYLLLGMVCTCKTTNHAHDYCSDS
jgi:hypothetical protein